MSMRKEIRNAFDQVHAPEDLTERLKQELYQKDFHEDADEMTWQVAEAPKRQLWRYPMYAAAVAAICVGCGLSVWSLRDQQTDFNPSTTVPVAVDSEYEEETTEPPTVAVGEE